MGFISLDDKLVSLLNIMDYQAWVQDMDTYYWANKAHAEFMGLTQDQCHNFKICKVLSEEERKQCSLSNKTVFEKEKRVKSKEWVKNKDGEKRLLSITKEPFKNDKGMVEYILCKAEDVTENTNLKGELYIVHKQLKNIIESQNDLIFRISPEMKYTFVNKIYANIYGKNPDDMIGKSMLDIVPADRTESLINLISKLNFQTPVGFLETSINNLRIQWVCKLIFDDKGRAMEYQAEGRDITEIKQVENELRQSHETLEQKVAERTKALKQLNDTLENEIMERTKTELLLRKRYEFEKALLKISSRFIKTLDIESAIADALNDLGNICQASRTCIFLFKNNGTVMDNTHEWCAQGVTPQIENHKNLSCDDVPWWVAKIKNNQNILIDDVSKLPVEASREKTTLGRQDVKSLIALPLAVKREIIGFIALHEVDEINKWSEEDFTVVRLFSEIIGNALERDLSRQELKDSNTKLQKLLEDTVNLLSSTIGMVDSYTADHQHRVADIACNIARHLEVSEDSLEGIKVAALLHDIGKLHVPASILSKPSKLTQNEFNLIKDHATMGHETLKRADFPWPVAQIVLQHHERIDGSGYPEGLKGEEILLEAKIVAVADVVEAMCSHRPYRPALNKEMAKKDILRNKGILYDSEIVDACLAVFFEKEHKKAN
ncbi:HD domain-containing protein [Metallumcola ferriviriculae]|uniref:HD domain-containing protein n=1 Tax=Metallumcola ferriviriculae TaxID=3039180 RepID=A0AAU0UTQ0_9FIRM|nr:HD domain-containing protein [Desulfitibacteraceae bacterium MK1]